MQLSRFDDVEQVSNSGELMSPIKGIFCLYTHSHTSQLTATTTEKDEAFFNPATSPAEGKTHLQVYSLLSPGGSSPPIPSVGVASPTAISFPVRDNSESSTLRSSPHLTCSN